MVTAAEKKATRVSRWFEGAGIKLNSCCKIGGVPDDSSASDSLGIFATQPLERGDVLAVIPKSAVLSIVNTAAAEFIERSELRGGLGLIFAILYERHVLLRKSKWSGYLKSLPAREYIPIFWSPSEVAHLRGTDLEGCHERDHPLLEEDFQLIQEVLRANPSVPTSGFTLDNYKAAASLVASRAFGVDDVHGMSLVPLADIFNHKCAHVKLSNDYVIEGASESDDDDEDSEEGSPGDDAVSHESDSDGAPSDAEHEDYTGASRRGDSHRGSRGHTMEAGDSKECALPTVLAAMDNKDAAFAMEIAICSTTRDGVDVLEIVAASEVANGDEVHNTYGELSNCDLVQKYGFALDNNQFDVVQLPLVPLVAAAGEYLGAKKAAKRVMFLRENSDLLDEDDSYLTLLPGSRLEAGVAAILWCLFANSSQFKACQDMKDVASNIKMLLSELPDCEDAAAAAVEPMDITLAAQALPAVAMQGLMRAVLARSQMMASPVGSPSPPLGLPPLDGLSSEPSAEAAGCPKSDTVAQSREARQAQKAIQTLAHSEAAIVTSALTALALYCASPAVPNRLQAQSDVDKEDTSPIKPSSCDARAQSSRKPSLENIASTKRTKISHARPTVTNDDLQRQQDQRREVHGIGAGQTLTPIMSAKKTSKSARRRERKRNMH